MQPVSNSNLKMSYSTIERPCLTDTGGLLLKVVGAVVASGLICEVMGLPKIILPLAGAVTFFYFNQPTTVHHDEIVNDSELMKSMQKLRFAEASFFVRQDSASNQKSE